METSSTRVYAIPRSAAPRAPAGGHCWPVPPQGTLTYSSGSVSVGWACVSCPSQVWAAEAARCFQRCAVPEGPCILITSPVLAARFPGCAVRAPSQVGCVSPLGRWSQAATLLEDVNHPGSQEDVVSSWEPAHSLVEDAVSGAETAAARCLPAPAVASLSLCLWVERGWSAACQLSPGVCSILCSMSRPGCVLSWYIRAFHWESSLFCSFS